jgi:hypothetical protein
MPPAPGAALAPARRWRGRPDGAALRAAPHRPLGAGRQLGSRGRRQVSLLLPGAAHLKGTAVLHLCGAAKGDETDAGVRGALWGLTPVDARAQHLRTRTHSEAQSSTVKAQAAAAAGGPTPQTTIATSTHPTITPTHPAARPAAQPPTHLAGACVHLHTGVVDKDPQVNGLAGAHEGQGPAHPTRLLHTHTERREGDVMSAAGTVLTTWEVPARICLQGGGYTAAAAAAGWLRAVS